MVITEKVTIRDKEYIKNYSDAGFYIERDGVEYSEAIDPIGYDRTYTETERLIEGNEATPEDYQNALKELGGRI